MSLKSIRQNYTKLISAFESAGVKLNESQKSDLDTFIVALESKIDQMKRNTVKITKKIVTEHLDKEYQKIFEQILENKAKNDELVGKIQAKVNSINESKKMARKVDNYLTNYVESILPEKTIVDYDRMKKLETLHESLKDLLLVNENAVEEKNAALEESFKKQKRDYETQIAKMQVKLNESMQKQLDLSNRIDKIKGKELLESKLKDMPDFEANQIRKRFNNATTTEIKENFKKVCESVKTEIKEEKAEEQTTLEDEISNILDSDDKKDVKKTETTKKVVEKEVKKPEEDNELDEDDDIKLDESEKIDEAQMAWWCNMAGNIETKGY